jgi:hypothetical protein
MACEDWSPIAARLLREREQEIKRVAISLFGRGKESDNKIPGPLPFALHYLHFPMVVQESFWISGKTDGVRALLLIRQRERDVHLIERNFSIHRFLLDSLSSRYSEAVASQGPTLLDGEIIRTTDGQWDYVAFDCISFNGTKFVDAHFPNRYDAVKEVARLCRGVPLPPSGLGPAPLFIRTKLWVPCKDVIQLFTDLNLNHQPTDGFILMKPDVGYMGPKPTNPKKPFMLKWKPVHTTDLIAQVPKSGHSSEVLLHAEDGGGRRQQLGCAQANTVWRSICESVKQSEHREKIDRDRGLPVGMSRVATSHLFKMMTLFFSRCFHLFFFFL